MENNTCRKWFCSLLARTATSAPPLCQWSPTSDCKVFLFLNALSSTISLGGVWWMFCLEFYSRKWSGIIRDKIEMSSAYITAQNVQAHCKTDKEKIIRMLVETRLHKYIRCAILQSSQVFLEAFLNHDVIENVKMRSHLVLSHELHVSHCVVESTICACC